MNKDLSEESKLVSLHACDSYVQEKVDEVIAKTLEDLGGIGRFAKKGDKVLLKVNLVAARDPSLAATSHPAFVEAIAKAFVNYGCRVVIGDSPGGVFNEAHQKKLYRITGMDRAAANSGAELSYDTGVRTAEFPQGKMMKTLTLTQMTADCDLLVSVAKVKTHGFMTYTGAVKNLFGSVPGTYKAEYHFRMPEMKDFAKALLDIHDAVSPGLYFIDAICGMEGNGPTNGSPRKIGAVLASTNGPNLDVAGCALIGLKPEDCPLQKEALDQGRSVSDAAELNIVGDRLEDFIVNDYKMPDHINTNAMAKYVPKGLGGVAEKLLRAKVTFDYSKCVGCGECGANCPAKAISYKDHRPSVDRSKCIRCYCCQELCPRDAVVIKKPLAFRIAGKM